MSSGRAAVPPGRYGTEPRLLRGRRVVLTGHTGFQGTWLALWLDSLGARVTGLALAHDTRPNRYEALSPWPQVLSVIADLRGSDTVPRELEAAEFSVISERDAGYPDYRP